MQDFTDPKLERERPTVSAKEAVDFCLRKLAEERVAKLTDYAVQGLTFEEIVGALLSARDSIELLEKHESGGFD